MRTSAKIGLLSSLYFAQGLPFGFFTQALPVVLRQEGVSLPKIGLASLVALPWALKFLWAPALDRLGATRLGRRRGPLLVLQLCAVAATIGIAFLPPTLGLSVLLGVVALSNLVSATQDIATDALAVDLLSTKERGLGNGVQVAAYRVGMIAGGSALLIAFERFGWTWTFLAMGVLLALSTVPVAAFREPPRLASAPLAPSGGFLLGDIQRFVSRPGMGVWISILVLYKSADAFGGGMVRPFLVDVGFSLTDIGTALGAFGFTGGLVGALAGGALVVPLGRRRALLLFGLLQAASIALYLVVSLGVDSLPYLCVAAFFENALGGTATAALFTVMMDHAEPETAASDYTFQASVVVIATGIGGALAGFSAKALGHAGHFAFSIVLCLVSLLAVRALLGREHLVDERDDLVPTDALDKSREKGAQP